MKISRPMWNSKKIENKNFGALPKFNLFILTIVSAYSSAAMKGNIFFITG